MHESNFLASSAFDHTREVSPIKSLNILIVGTGCLRQKFVLLDSVTRPPYEPRYDSNRKVRIDSQGIAAQKGEPARLTVPSAR